MTSEILTRRRKSACTRETLMLRPRRASVALARQWTAGGTATAHSRLFSASRKRYPFQRAIRHEDL